MFLIEFTNRLAVTGCRKFRSVSTYESDSDTQFTIFLIHIFIVVFYQNLKSFHSALPSSNLSSFLLLILHLSKFICKSSLEFFFFFFFLNFPFKYLPLSEAKQFL